MGAGGKPTVAAGSSTASKPVPSFHTDTTSAGRLPSRAAASLSACSAAGDPSKAMSTGPEATKPGDYSCLGSLRSGRDHRGEQLAPALEPPPADLEPHGRGSLAVGAGAARARHQREGAETGIALVLDRGEPSPTGQAVVERDRRGPVAQAHGAALVDDRAPGEEARRPGIVVGVERIQPGGDHGAVRGWPAV